MNNKSEAAPSISGLLSVPDWRRSWEKYLQENEQFMRKATDAPPVWVRAISGALGFFSSLLALGIPGIALLIVDRLIPSESAASLWSLAALGVGTAVSVCLIDLLRMRALETYLTNVRGLVLYQDSCFALFWGVILAFLHPLISLIVFSVAATLYLVWRLRKPHQANTHGTIKGQDADPIIADAAGLGPAYLQQAAEGKIASKEQPDFQSVAQTTWLNFIQFSSAIATIAVAAWLQISGAITLGTMLAVVFLNQYITAVFVRFYQVQALKPAKPDLSFMSLIENGQALDSKSKTDENAMALLSIVDLEDKGFAPFSADLFQGLCLALIGPSGSGKSEILRAIATGQFSEGKITYKDRNWGRNHGRMNSLSYSAIPPIALEGTVVENVTCFDPTATPLPAIELLRKLDPFEDVFREKDFLNDSIDQNYAAQGQITSLARAFWMDSDILVLDQPETYLDKASRSALMALILRAKTEGKIVVLATDDEYLMSVADELVKLERGEVTDRGPMEEVLQRHHQRWVRVSFMPTKREAFRLTLWLEAQFPQGMDEELKQRVKQTAQDMLFFTPRDQVMGNNDEILFDVRLGPHEVFITMHDRGDVLGAEQMDAKNNPDFNRVISQSDGFEQTLREGYRQCAVRFSEDRSTSDEKLLAGG